MSHHIRSFRLKRYRWQAFKKQKGRCYYFHSPMWLGSTEEFADNYGITEIQAERFQCTAEHLIARQNGGTDERENIVAACLYCNFTRHNVSEALPHNEDREHVASLVQSQEWHPREFHHLM